MVASLPSTCAPTATTSRDSAAMPLSTSGNSPAIFIAHTMPGSCGTAVSATLPLSGIPYGQSSELSASQATQPSGPGKPHSEATTTSKISAAGRKLPTPSASPPLPSCPPLKSVTDVVNEDSLHETCRDGIGQAEQPTINQANSKTNHLSKPHSPALDSPPSPSHVLQRDDWQAASLSQFNAGDVTIPDFQADNAPMADTQLLSSIAQEFRVPFGFESQNPQSALDHIVPSCSDDDLAAEVTVQDLVFKEPPPASQISAQGASASHCPVLSPPALAVAVSASTSASALDSIPLAPSEKPSFSHQDDGNSNFFTGSLAVMAPTKLKLGVPIVDSQNVDHNLEDGSDRSHQFGFSNYDGTAYTRVESERQSALAQNNLKTVDHNHDIKDKDDHLNDDIVDHDDDNGDTDDGENNDDTSSNLGKERKGEVLIAVCGQAIGKKEGDVADERGTLPLQPTVSTPGASRNQSHFNTHQAEVGRVDDCRDANLLSDAAGLENANTTALDNDASVGSVTSLTPVHTLRNQQPHLPPHLDMRGEDTRTVESRVVPRKLSPPTHTALSTSSTLPPIPTASAVANKPALAAQLSTAPEIVDPVTARMRRARKEVSACETVEALLHKRSTHGAALTFGLLALNCHLTKICAFAARLGVDGKNLHDECTVRLKQSLTWLAAVADADMCKAPRQGSILNSAAFPSLEPFQSNYNKVETINTTMARLQHSFDCHALIDLSIARLNESVISKRSRPDANASPVLSETVTSLSKRVRNSGPPVKKPRSTSNSPALTHAQTRSLGGGKPLTVSTHQPGASSILTKPLIIPGALASSPKLASNSPASRVPLSTPPQPANVMLQQKHTAKSGPSGPSQMSLQHQVIQQQQQQQQLPHQALMQQSVQGQLQQPFQSVSHNVVPGAVNRAAIPSSQQSSMPPPARPVSSSSSQKAGAVSMMGGNFISVESFRPLMEQYTALHSAIQNPNFHSMTCDQQTAYRQQHARLHAMLQQASSAYQAQQQQHQHQQPSPFQMQPVQQHPTFAGSPAGTPIASSPPHRDETPGVVSSSYQHPPRPSSVAAVADSASTPGDNYLSHSQSPALLHAQIKMVRAQAGSRMSMPQSPDRANSFSDQQGGPSQNYVSGQNTMELTNEQQHTLSGPVAYRGLQQQEQQLQLPEQQQQQPLQPRQNSPSQPLSNSSNQLMHESALSSLMNSQSHAFGFPQAHHNHAGVVQAQRALAQQQHELVPRQQQTYHQMTLQQQQQHYQQEQQQQQQLSTLTTQQQQQQQPTPFSLQSQPLLSHMAQHNSQQHSFHQPQFTPSSQDLPSSQQQTPSRAQIQHPQHQQYQQQQHQPHQQQSLTSHVNPTQKTQQLANMYPPHMPMMYNSEFGSGNSNGVPNIASIE